MATPAGMGVTLLRITIVMLVLSWATVAARLSVRRWLKPEAMGMDDHMMCIGLVLYSITCALVIACAFDGAGQYSKYLTPGQIEDGTKLFYIAEFFYAACTVPIKSSICVCLVRIADGRRRFAWTLWGLIALQFGAAVIFIVAIGNICHPVDALWGARPGVCNARLNSAVSFFFSAVSIVTDLMLAILPAILIWPIQMKRRVKTSVVVILGMAAFASCATIIRLRYLTLYNDQAEYMYSAGPIGLWSIIEEGIGIVAGSLPALRPILTLRIFGGSRNDSQPSKGLSQGDDLDSHTWGTSEHGASRSVELKTYVTGPTHIGGNGGGGGGGGNGKPKLSRDGDSDGESQTHILKETRVTVSREQANPSVAEQWKWRRVNGWSNQSSQKGEP